MKQGDQKLKQSKSVVEALRIQRTSLNQKDFAKACGIPVKTYQRWVSGETEARPTLTQLKAVCRNLMIEKVEELPDDFAEKHQVKN